MEIYEVLINGIPHTVQLDKAPKDAKPGKAGTEDPKKSEEAAKAKEEAEAKAAAEAEAAAKKEAEEAAKAAESEKAKQPANKASTPAAK
ncbi:hypothetical protein [Paenarthrobacter nitroguajacolicus]|uniref:hypothetical protein n=1 Tax=Paenarthrobacter nitroguajacolicus TaxID=211146 RepID=UPI0015C10F09|nr:hypothetical protein [Paenarthrobacter nitroguajacolicus]